MSIFYDSTCYDGYFLHPYFSQDQVKLSLWFMTEVFEFWNGINNTLVTSIYSLKNPVIWLVKTIMKACRGTPSYTYLQKLSQFVASNV